MALCLVLKCKNTTRKKNKKDGISYFRFPEDPDMRSEWISIIAKDRKDPNFKLPKYQRICSDHFRLQDMYTTKTGMRRITKEAKPMLNLSVHTLSERNSSSSAITPQMPLTPAERQRRYREKLKMQNPDKYEEYKKKAAAKSLLYYRETVIKYTEEEKEKRRRQWRDVRRNQTSPAKKQMPLTSAERQKKYRERLKTENPHKYEEYKKKVATKSLLYYREKVSKYTEEEKEKRRQQWRDLTRNQTRPAKTQMPLTSAERQRKYRERLKKENPDKYEEYKKKVAAKSLLYYREKVSKYTEEEKEKRRQQWRDARRNQTSRAKKQMRLTSAERQRKYRERLKKENPDKYEEFKKKVAENARVYYRQKASQYTGDEKEKSRQQCNATKLSSAEGEKKIQEERKTVNHEKHEDVIKNMENAVCNKGIQSIPQTTQNGIKKQVRKRLTPAERQRRYREKLKRENPMKYLDLKKKSAENSRQYYRENVSNRDASLKRPWNDVRGKALSPGERMKRYRERLKRENPAKYADLLKKNAETAKRYYREKAKLYTEEEREERRQKWREARRIDKKKQNKRWKHKQNETQMSSEEESSSEEDAQPGPSEAPMTPPWRPNSPGVADNSQDPLSTLADQCRFCGEFSKDCLIVSSHMPYLAGTKTALGLNDISVQLDFNDDLPKTVCCNCNTKLQEYCDFIKAVKTAQETLKRKIKTEPEDVREIEDVFIKTEAPEEEEDTNSITISDTVFVKKKSSYKRKGNVMNQKAKVAKNMVECENELIVNVKQEIVDDDEHIESSRPSGAGSETLSIPDELKCSYVSDIADKTLSVSEVIKKGRIGSDTTVNATSDLTPQIVSGNLT